MISSNNQVSLFALKIERGRTKHPERLISEDRFLIGAGSNCHLQLGGEMPILHSIIIQSSEGLWIDAVVREPSLLVNRQPVQACQLVAGDLIEIGTFVFEVVEKQAEELEQIEFDTADENVDLQELNAEDLVDLLAVEIQQLEELQEAKQAGAAALLERIASLDEEEVNAAEEFLPADQIHALERELQERAVQLDEREALLAEKAAHLQRAQERLENYLERLTRRVADETREDDDSPFRKTA